MSGRQYNRASLKQEDVIRLKQLFQEGCQVMQEIDDLRDSFGDTVKAIAEELEIKPSQLKKAVRIAYKQSFTEEQEQFTEIEDILDVVGRK